MNPEERRMLFTKGFGDGAKASAVKLAFPDYIEGYRQGLEARRDAIQTYCTEQGLPSGNPLREEDTRRDTFETYFPPGNPLREDGDV